ncbi:hypothetical protein N7499_006408 [Penicillium canescens]|uniref:SnoaL-like domain-containing protein n=1 Tax=Penicillium canescens TaxID=5083 RepID=A0AAD6IDE4_PENCN|nr:uncharacterized protein N7446_002095 [Penicillium canescens]KAJ5997289.1 hypothetical protein N7522_008949 [Penicillium canescens]KAJ6043898.1 hypothetical protein N7460_005253 [Penicillium canescens]KAJ6055370.1 hypothetical protein N7444_004468 [Penicillium canescens]KAJ6074318.1 hypothetical protein N7446_002095 [Penicillium canescens]KAJ6081534.1 hypothetical protein N7499_006408 [Penicillium canescens]
MPPAAPTPHQFSTREAITDTIYRGVLGIDTNDLDLFVSALHDSPTTNFEINGEQYQGIEAIKPRVFDRIGPLDTTHTVSNVRIEMEDGAEMASLTAHVLAQHYRAGEGSLGDSKGVLVGGLYFVDLVRSSDDGWRITTWKIKMIWMDGDKGVIGL